MYYPYYLIEIRTNDKVDRKDIFCFLLRFKYNGFYQTASTNQGLFKSSPTIKYNFVITLLFQQVAVKP